MQTKFGIITSAR